MTDTTPIPAGALTVDDEPTMKPAWNGQPLPYYGVRHEGDIIAWVSPDQCARLLASQRPPGVPDDSPPLVYIAAPFTSPDPSTNTNRAVRFATALYEASGGAVVPFVPHLSMLWHTITPLPYEDWLAIDMAVVDRCTAVIRLKGESPGADGKAARARSLGIPVIEAGNDDAAGVYKWLARVLAETMPVPPYQPTEGGQS